MSVFVKSKKFLSNIKKLNKFYPKLSNGFYEFLQNYADFGNRKNLKLKNQIIGTIFSSIALNIVSYVFSIYLDLFKGFSITYGSLTTLILIMMWIYTCFYIIFLGAEINKSTNSKEK